MDKIKVAIIELETHTQVIKQWDCFLSDSEVIDVDYYLHSKLKVNLSFLDSRKTTYTDAIGNSELKAFVSDIPQYDLIIINTMHRHFEIYESLLENQKILCMIHNPNFSLFHHPVRIGNLWKERKNSYYLLKLFLLERIRKHQDIVFAANFFGVLSDAIYREVIENGAVPIHKVAHISLTFNEYFSFPKQLPINIVISGTVSEKRKDYQLVFDTIKKLRPKSHLVFYFLGRPENAAMEQKLKALSKLQTENLKIIYYKKLIPSAAFDAVIRASHILLCPIKIKTSFYGVTEFYGRTKVSGNEYDCVRNGKIGLYPVTYPKMHWHNLYYGDKTDLTSILNNLSMEQLENEYQKLQSYIPDYTFEKVKNQLEEQLLNLTKTK